RHDGEPSAPTPLRSSIGITSSQDFAPKTAGFCPCCFSQSRKYATPCGVLTSIAALAIWPISSPKLMWIAALNTLGDSFLKCSALFLYCSSRSRSQHVRAEHLLSDAGDARREWLV